MTPKDEYFVLSDKDKTTKDEYFVLSDKDKTTTDEYFVLSDKDMRTGGRTFRRFVPRLRGRADEYIVLFSKSALSLLEGPMVGGTGRR